MSQKRHPPLRIASFEREDEIINGKCFQTVFETPSKGPAMIHVIYFAHRDQTEALNFRVFLEYELQTT